MPYVFHRFSASSKENRHILASVLFFLFLFSFIRFLSSKRTLISEISYFVLALYRMREYYSIERLPLRSRAFVFAVTYRIGLVRFGVDLFVCVYSAIFNEIVAANVGTCAHLLHAQQNSFSVAKVRNQPIGETIYKCVV